MKPLFILAGYRDNYLLDVVHEFDSNPYIKDKTAYSLQNSDYEFVCSLMSDAGFYDMMDAQESEPEKYSDYGFLIPRYELTPLTDHNGYIKPLKMFFENCDNDIIDLGRGINRRVANAALDEVCKFIVLGVNSKRVLNSGFLKLANWSNENSHEQFRLCCKQLKNLDKEGIERKIALINLAALSLSYQKQII